MSLEIMIHVIEIRRIINDFDYRIYLEHAAMAERLRRQT